MYFPHTNSTCICIISLS